MKTRQREILAFMLEGISSSFSARWLAGTSGQVVSDVSRLARDSDSMFPVSGSFDSKHNSSYNKLQSLAGLSVSEVQAFATDLGMNNEGYKDAAKKLVHSSLFLIIDARSRPHVTVWVPESAESYFSSLSKYFRSQTDDTEVEVVYTPMSWVFGLSSKYPRSTKTTTGLLWNKYPG